MEWVIIPEKYLNYLRASESRIPKSDYGKDKYKPFFGILFETDTCYYVTQVSSVKSRHQKMKTSIDFHKLYNEKNNKLLAVVNLNYMFPVPKVLVKKLKYSEMDDYRDFKSECDKSKYISLLKLELNLINNLNLEKSARKLYKLRYDYPNNYVSKRCLDFQELEKLADKYLIQL